MPDHDPEKAREWAFHRLQETIKVGDVRAERTVNAARTLLALLEERDKLHAGIAEIRARGDARRQAFIDGQPVPAFSASCGRTRADAEHMVQEGARAFWCDGELRHRVSEGEPTIRPLSQAELLLYTADLVAHTHQGASNAEALEAAAMFVCELRPERHTPEHTEAFRKQVRGG